MLDIAFTSAQRASATTSAALLNWRGGTADLVPKEPPKPGLEASDLASVRLEGWFRVLPDRTQAALLQQASVRRCTPDERVHGIDDAHSVDVVLQGALCIGTTTEAEEDSRPLLYVEPGRWHMDTGLLLGGERLHTVRAHGKTRILTVPAPVIEQLQAEDPALRHALKWLHFRHMAELMRVLEEAATRAFHQRLCGSLVRLLRSFGRKQPCGTLIDLPMNQRELSRLIGGSRQRVNLELKALQRSGVLGPGDWRLVLNRDALAAAALARGAL